MSRIEEINIPNTNDDGKAIHSELLGGWKFFLAGEAQEIDSEYLPEQVEAKQTKDYQKLSERMNGLRKEEQQELMRSIGDEYLEFIRQSPKKFQSVDEDENFQNVSRFSNFVRAYGWWGDLGDFIGFSRKIRKMARENNFLSVFRFEGYHPPVFLIEEKKEDLKKIFEKGDPEKTEEALDFLIDAAYNVIHLKSVRPPEKIEEYCSQMVQILKDFENSSDNYFNSIKIKHSMKEFESILSFGVKNIEKQIYLPRIFNAEIERAKIGMFQDYDLDFREITEEAEKLKKKNGYPDPDDEGVLADINNYSLFYDKRIQRILIQDLGLDFTLLPKDERRRACFFVLGFLKRIKKEEKQRYQKYFDGGGNESGRADRIMAFLALEIKGNNGEKIIDIGEKLEAQEADRVFQKISELSRKTEKELVEIFGDNFHKEELLNETRRELLKRAHGIIEKFYEKLEKGESGKAEIEKLLSDIENSGIEIDLLSSMLKAAKTAKERVDFETVKFLDLYEKQTGEDLPDEEKKEILELAKDNYFNDVYKDNSETAQGVIDDLEVELYGEGKMKNQRAYILKYQGKIIAFCRFAPLEEKPGEVYAGSLNVYKDLQNLCVGGYFVKTVLEKESRENVIHAITRADNPANETYGKLGFRFEEQDFEKNGVKYFNIIMDKPASK